MNTYPAAYSSSLKHLDIFFADVCDKIVSGISPRTKLMFSGVKIFAKSCLKSELLIEMHLRVSLIAMTPIGLYWRPLASVKSPKTEPASNFYSWFPSA